MMMWRALLVRIAHMVEEGYWMIAGFCQIIAFLVLPLLLE